MGLLIITLPNFMVCLPLIALWLFFNPKEIPLKRKTAWVAVFALVSLIPVGLTWARNTFARGESVLISHAGGINFYIGNNENVQRTVSIRPKVPVCSSLRCRRPLRRCRADPSSAPHFS